MSNDSFKPLERRSPNFSDLNTEIPFPDPLNDRLIDLDWPMSVRKVQPQGEYQALSHSEGRYTPAKLRIYVVEPNYATATN